MGKGGISGMGTAGGMSDIGTGKSKCKSKGGGTNTAVLIDGFISGIAIPGLPGGPPPHSPSPLESPGPPGRRASGTGDNQG